jgi:gamma-glutamyltranspeptidase/glutathione hydrolase
LLKPHLLFEVPARTSDIFPHQNIGGLMRNLELPGRSPVHATQGMASTSSPLATLAAVDVLKSGGNAMDAAIAACAVQCVVEPESTGIGGDCFCLYSPGGSDKIIAFNGSGRAPLAATPEWFAEQGITKIERQSAHAVSVPSAIDGWDRLLKAHGTKGFDELLRPAIGYARDGYPVGSRVSVDFASQIDIIRDDENLSRVFLKDGKTPAAGSLHRQGALANTLEAIAKGGRDAFYTGEIAEDIVGYLRSKGGLHTMEDFASVEGTYVDPISTQYKGYTVHQCPPNGQGVIALLLLNIMSGIEAGDDPLSPERIHSEIEAGRLAYHDRQNYLADPAQAEVPVEWLLSAEHADELRKQIDAAKAMAEMPSIPGPSHKDTVYITVVDKDRNACSFINTLYYNFGSGLMAPKSGVVLHNRAMGFSLDPNHPNCIAPGKRPMHTIIPGLVSKDGKIVMSYGVMGGEYQAYGHMQFLSRMFDFGLDIQEAQDLPRVFPDPETGDVQAESGLPEELAKALRDKGHKLIAPAKPIGGSQAIWIDWEEGVLTGGSDPRKDGCALGY